MGSERKGRWRCCCCVCLHRRIDTGTLQGNQRSGVFSVSEIRVRSSCALAPQPQCFRVWCSSLFLRCAPSMFQGLGFMFEALLRSVSVSGFGFRCAASVFQGLGFQFQAPLRSLSDSESRVFVLALLLLPDVVSYCFTKCFAITVRNYCPPVVPHRVYSSRSVL